MLLKTMSASARACAAGMFGLALAMNCAHATPYLVVDAASGHTLIENQATLPWYPASLTKLMTTYVALDAVKQGRLTMDTPLTMSFRAARMPASKMGFEPGTEVTLDNALKMLMVKSPNDVAVMVAESISGSVESFADEMNATAAKLGMRESHFVNPNGLHDPEHVSSARDMALVARALLEEFPEHVDLFSIGALQLDGIVIANHNGLLGHYAGADGMKTGFTCSSGFNVVASATRDGRKLIAVVLGAPTVHMRTLETAQLLERGFNQTDAGPQLAELPRAQETKPRDMRPDICSRRSAAAIEAAEEEVFAPPKAVPAPVAANGRGRGQQAPTPAETIASAEELLTRANPHFDPVPVFVGAKPGWSGPVLAAKPTPAAPPAAASAYSADKPAEAQSAPLALQGAVKPPEAPKKVAAKPPEPKHYRVAARPRPKAAKPAKSKNDD